MGEQEAEALVTFVDHKLKDNNESDLNIHATKEDMQKLNVNMSSLEVKIADAKSEMIRWMFIFWIGQVAVTFGLIIVYLKK